MDYDIYTPSAGWERRSRSLSGREWQALEIRVEQTGDDWLVAAQDLFGRRAGFPAHGDIRIVKV